MANQRCDTGLEAVEMLIRPFQLEAAVQSAHCHRLFTGQTPWQGIAALYQQINKFYPTEGAGVAGAVALAEAGDVAAGLQQLDAMNRGTVKVFNPGGWRVATCCQSKARAQQTKQTPFTKPRLA